MKKIIIAILTVCCVLCLCAGLLACDKKTEEPKIDTVSYTVMVSCQDSDVLAGLKIKLTDSDGRDASEAVAPENGLAKFDLPAGTYKVVVTGMPDGYEQNTAVLTATSLKATVTVSAVAEEQPAPKDENVTYNVTVLKPDGSAVPDVMVQICVISTTSGACYTSKTNSAGVAEFKLPKGSYSIHIPECPEGFEFDDEQYQISDSEPDVSVYLNAENAGKSLYNGAIVVDGDGSVTLTADSADETVFF